MPYLNLAGFRDLTIASAQRIEQVELRFPGWILAQLEHYSDHIDARLRKRYAAPFQEPVPPAIKRWLCALVTPRIYLKGGIDASDEQFGAVQAEAAAAEADLKEAADAAQGLFDLPLRADVGGASGIARGGPRGYSEHSPYRWRTLQRDEARDEDSLG